jgi:hypothetical protein
MLKGNGGGEKRKTNFCTTRGRQWETTKVFDKRKHASCAEAILQQAG